MLPMQPGDVPLTFADVSDLLRDTGLKPEISIAASIAEFVA
jgi:UDP-glucuronate 4-epimerase